MPEPNFNFTLSDQQRIHGRAWHPTETTRGVIVLVHGLGEHVERYDGWAKRFNRAGYVVIGSDHRGHGRSEGKRGHVSGYGIFLEEIDQLIGYAREHYAEQPVFLYGHSLGGSIVLNYVLDRQPSIAGVVVTSPYIREATPQPALKIAAGRLLKNLLPSFTVPNDLPVEYVATDPEVVAAYKSDPLVHDRVSTTMGAEIMDAAKRLDEYSGNFPAPLLIMHAGEDHLTGEPGSAAFAERVGGDVLYRKWDGMYHEIHHDVNRSDVFDFTLDWMDRKNIVA